MWQIFWWLLWKLADGEARLHLPHPCEGLLDWVNCCGKTQSKRGQPYSIQSGTEYRDASKPSSSLQSVCFPAADIMSSADSRSCYQGFPAIGLCPQAEEGAGQAFPQVFFVTALGEVTNTIMTFMRVSSRFRLTNDFQKAPSLIPPHWRLKFLPVNFEGRSIESWTHWMNPQETSRVLQLPGTSELPRRKVAWRGGETTGEAEMLS